MYLRFCQCRLLPHLLLPGLGVCPGGALHRLRARGELHDLTNQRPLSIQSFFITIDQSEASLITVDQSGWLHVGLLSQRRHRPELVPAREQGLHRESGAEVRRSQQPDSLFLQFLCHIMIDEANNYCSL